MFGSVPVFQVFASSTFADLGVEHAALHSRVFPELRQLSAGRGALWQRQREGHPVTAGDLIQTPTPAAQYTSNRFTEHLALEGIRPSIGTVGDAYDNEAPQV
jgi:transposase InsO family protein